MRLVLHARSFAVSDGALTTIWRAICPERVAEGAEERVTEIVGERPDPQPEASGQREQTGGYGGGTGQRDFQVWGDWGKTGVQSGGCSVES